MGKDAPWKPGDGVEQVDATPDAAQARAATGHFTPAHRSDEDEPGFDAAYLRWRREHGTARDSDYRRWRAETGQPFSDAFLAWAAEEEQRRPKDGDQGSA